MLCEEGGAPLKESKKEIQILDRDTGIESGTGHATTWQARWRIYTIYIYRRLRGSGVAPDTGKSASFRSCVRCEAVRVRDEERFRWLAFSKFERPPVSLWRFQCFGSRNGGRCWGFKRYERFCMLCVGVLREFL